jgi:hypothetical protein
MFFRNKKNNKIQKIPIVLHHTIPSHTGIPIITSTPTGTTTFNTKSMFTSAVTYSWVDPEEAILKRKKELMDEFEQNPELFSEIMVELRKRKIKKLKESI